MQAGDFDEDHEQTKSPTDARIINYAKDHRRADFSTSVSLQDRRSFTIFDLLGAKCIVALRANTVGTRKIIDNYYFHH